MIKNFKYQSNKGQLVVGLAFCFMCFLAFLSLIYQSSLLVREKMKLQQTTDYAALTGASVQRALIEKVIDANKDIDRAFVKLTVALKASPCAGLIGSGFGSLATLTTLAQVASPGLSQPTCPSACRAIDNAAHDIALAAYETTRSRIASYIAEILAQGNAIAADYAQEQFFVRRNLPVRLNAYTIEKYGRNVSRDRLRGVYQSDRMQNSLYLYHSGNSSGNSPLFVAEEGTRSVTLMQQNAAVGPTALDGTPICYLPVPPTPKIQTVKGKIGKDPQTYPTHFVMASVYDPPSSSVEGAFNLSVRNPYSEDREALSTDGGQSVALLPDKETRSPRRWPLMTMSLAKSFGGEMPRVGGNLSNGNAGDYPTGVKLVGFSDPLAMEGQSPRFFLNLAREEILDSFPQMADMLTRLERANWQEMLH